MTYIIFAAAIIAAFFAGAFVRSPFEIKPKNTNTHNEEFKAPPQSGIDRQWNELLDYNTKAGDGYGD